MERRFARTEKTSFEIKQNDSGREYIELTYNPATRKEQGDESMESIDNPIIFSQPGNHKCLVYSFKLYCQS